MSEQAEQLDARAPGGDRAFIGHARTVAGLTLVSRVLGLVRDAVCSRAFGAGPLWSAFATALIIPNVFRRLFGEGALSAAFIPEYAQLLKHDSERSRRFASLTIAMLITFLGLLTFLGELLLSALLLFTPIGDSGRSVLIFAMVMLPYMPLVCATALLGGMLQSHGRFIPHAGAPMLFNLCIIIAATIFAFSLKTTDFTAILAVSVSIVIAGVLQIAWCLLALRPCIRWTRTFDDAGAAVRRMLRRMGPVIIGMGALQLGTMIDALIAGWPVAFGPTIAGINYPLDTAAASNLYYAQRLYQFPLGVFAIAIATAVFPALARSADDAPDFAATLRRGIRLSLFIGIPATAGLVIVRLPLTGTLYAGGEFGEEDVRRVGRVLLGYAPAVWAYSLMHVFTRAFYARGMTSLPMRIGLFTLLANVIFNLLLIWTPLREAGLAWATSICSMGQALALGILAERHLRESPEQPLLDRPTRISIAMTIVLTLAMAAALLPIEHLSRPSDPVWSIRMLRLGVLTVLGLVIYLIFALVLRRPELRWLLQRGRSSKNA